MRLHYAAEESALDSQIYEIRDDYKPDESLYEGYVGIPSEFPRLEDFIGYLYIINLDREVLTMNFTIHWKLSNIPRQDDLWLRSITDSIYTDEQTISLDVCPEEHVASPALEIPEPNMKLNYAGCLVHPRTRLVEASETFVTQNLAGLIMRYSELITQFGLEWCPESLPFRELAFALVSIASSHARMLSMMHDAQGKNKPDGWKSDLNWRGRKGWVGPELVGDSAPILEFCSPCHRPNEPPGVSPMETIYWHQGVLVSLVMVADGSALNKAIAWGIEKGFVNFQIIILSLFEVAFAEVSMVDSARPFVKFSHAVSLSPLSAGDCLSTHPRTRPPMQPEQPGRGTWREKRGTAFMRLNTTWTRGNLQKHYPGLAALVKFFEVAADRRAVSKTAGVLPTELYARILDFVDYDTWNKCLFVSTSVRALCLRKYRIDDRWRIVGKPWATCVPRLHRSYPRMAPHLASFDFEDMQTGEIIPMMRGGYYEWKEQYAWAPSIGGDRSLRVLMLDVPIQFKASPERDWPKCDGECPDSDSSDRDSAESDSSVDME